MNMNKILTTILLTWAGLCHNLGKPRYAKHVAVVGEEVEVDCDIDVDDDGLIVWKHGKRVLFAGTLRIRRDYRMGVTGKK